MFRSSNPVLSDKVFAQRNVAAGEGMTIQGTVNKSFVLFGLILLTASFTWGQSLQALQMGAAPATGWMWGGAIAGLIFALITIFKPTWSPFTAPVYALCHGLFLGAISAIYQFQYQGIVFQAVLLTFSVMGVLLLGFKSGFIKVTDKMRSGIIMATGAIFLVYVLSMVLGFFGVSIPLIHGSGPMGILFSLVVVVVASLNLLLDFDFIQRASQQNAPSYMEWMGAFGLMVTLIWLYLEMLRLLSKLNGRR